MKRKIFFWMEQLKINPSERKTMAILFVSLMVLSLARAVISPSVPYDDASYRTVEEAFRERVELVRAREEQVLAKYRADTLESGTDSTNTEQAGRPEKININTAGAQKLVQLPGIGPAYAARIIEHREKNGPFTALEQLIEIRGIGKKRLEKLKPFIKLKDSE